MITNNELNAVKLSATKKDYYQIWNELIEIAGKISDRWDPATTNESDPGIVLLKVLTAIADKINYNIDVNTLEAFMPSAAQTESMRNLCEMMGYNVKYYRSATTEVNIKYTGDASKQFTEDLSELVLPMFTTISNQEKDVNYVTLETRNFSPDNILHTIPVMEGQHVQCETINNNVVTIDMLDDNNKFYLPETQIAENGIFIYSINDGIKSDRWEKKDSLHTEHFNNQIYKFGYDSKEARPYVQFPEDIGQIIGDGLEIHYIRTSGIAGNISAMTLNYFEASGDDTWEGFSTESDFVVTQFTAAMNGANIETITEAYQGFKKTIGTFDTLVTCRDYMNKIYNLMETDNIPMVSNVIVSDIRDDINRSVTICGFNDFGVCYTEKAIEEDGKKLIDHFDLILYPFNTVYGHNSRAEYEGSFIFNADNGYNIQKELEENKTIAHAIKYPNEDEIALIKNFLKLDAKIITTYKVSVQEEIEILSNIKTNIFKNFNLRNLDFSEEIPFDDILTVIENADVRIKNVVLNEPVLYTKFATVDGYEYDTASVLLTNPEGHTTEVKYIGKELYNKLALRNILAGRIELFNYNKTFKYSLNEYVARHTDENNKITTYNTIYPNPDSKASDREIKRISSIEPRFELGTKDETNNTVEIPSNYVLETNQKITFRSPNFKTDMTYPAYVNYFLKLENVETKSAVAAEFTTLGAFLNTQLDSDPTADNWDVFLNYINNKKYKNSDIDKTFIEDIFLKINKTNIDSEYEISYSSCIAKYGVILTREIKRDTDSNNNVYWFNRVTVNSEDKDGNKLVNGDTLKKDVTFYYLAGTYNSFRLLKEFLANQFKKGIYRLVNSSSTRLPGYLVDEYGSKFAAVDSQVYADYLKNYYVPIKLGEDAVYSNLPKDSEYQLKPGEYLLINYTPSKSTTTEDGTPVNEEGDPLYICYGPGCIIKPNFEVGDSATLVANSIKAYSKKNVNFTNCERYGLPVDITDITKVNMFGLGASEKIEHRNIVSLTLKKGYNLFWALNDIAAANNEMKETSRYILKENEYFFIASAEKDAMSYYGNGTELYLNSLSEDAMFFGDPETTDTSVSLEEILMWGIAGVPWKFTGFNQNKNLSITEYQYITLGSSDTLVSVDAGEPLTNTWQEVTKASYISGGTNKSLPILNIDKGLLTNKLKYENEDTSNEEKETIAKNESSWVANKNIGWEVKSSLVMQTNDTNSIKLVDNESIIINGYDSYDNKTSIEIKGNKDEPVVIKTSYAINGSLDSINTELSTSGEEISDFTIKVCTEKPLGLTIVNENNRIDESVVKLHNFGDNLTNIHFNKFLDVNNYVEFNFNVPANCYGLLMMYYAKGSAKGAYLEYVGTNSTSNLKIFNNYSANTANLEEEWWSDLADAEHPERRYLKPGINIIKIEPSISKIKLYPNEKMDHSVVVSDLDIVWANNDLNLELLDYQYIQQNILHNIDTINWTIINNSNIGDNTSLKGEIIEYNTDYKLGTYYPDGIPSRLVRKNKSNIKYYRGNQITKTDNYESEQYKNWRYQLLSELNKFDPNHEFYYNCKLDNSIAIDLNTDLLDTEDPEFLSTPRIWFDSNNINNKFVVAEIDAAYLEDGIKIARSSKK